MDLVVEGARVTVDVYVAPSYVDAMHRLCVTCHTERAQQDTTRQAMALCPVCHVAPPVEYIRAEMRDVLPKHEIRPVVMPAPDLVKEKKSRELDGQ